MPDQFQINMMMGTAQSFQELAALRGISSQIEVKDGRYIANGTNCGTSVHGLYEWLDKQPGVKP